jgi:hypothetical protein
MKDSQAVIPSIIAALLKTSTCLLGLPGRRAVSASCNFRSFSTSSTAKAKLASGCTILHARADSDTVKAVLLLGSMPEFIMHLEDLHLKTTGTTY